MRRRLLSIFVLLVLAPVGAVAYLVAESQGRERTMAKVELARVFEARLADLDGTIERATGQLERRFVRLLEPAAVEPQRMRELVRGAPLVRQAFVLAPNGRLAFPPNDQTTSADERAFLERTRPIWDRRAILYNRPTEDDKRRTKGDGGGDSVLALAASAESGWITWYWREGLHLLFWRRADGGGVVGVEVERIALLSRLLGSLPDVEVDGGRITLQDSRGDPVYQWGTYEPEKGEAPIAVRTLAYPLDAWRLAYYLSGERKKQLIGARVSGSNTLLAFGGLVFALALMAVYFYRESSRDFREAAARVGFVTQVSHELKTPLSNIRLYAELLEARLEDEDPEAVQRLGVIVAESERLTRLINNILTYARQRREKQQIEPKSVVIDDVVDEVLRQFAPALEERSIEVRFERGAPDTIRADPDAVGQILANLVSNVEKYGEAGGQLVLTSDQNDDGVTVTVADDGPGIPANARTRVFEPFFRASDRLADGVTGTGIGLSIARELARQHGGDLALVDTERGACFALTLPRGEGT